MSKIENLLKELCPNGVKYSTLQEICQIKTGKLNANAQVENGKYPFFTCDSTPFKIDTYAFDTEAILISGNGSQVGHINYYNGKFNAYQRTYVLSNFKIEKVPFLLHYLKAYLRQYIFNFANKGSVPYITLPMLQTFEVPIPPLEIQQEIAKVLDNFTNLKAELQAELQARKEQYEYYRDEFYGGTFERMVAELENGNIKAKRLSELGTFVRGKRFVRADVVENGYPCIHYGDMYTYYGIKATETKTYIKEEKAAKLRFANKGDVVIVGAGENKDDIGVGLAWLGESSPAVHDACFIYKHTDELDPMYISHFLRTRVYHIQIHKHVVEAKICSLASDKIGTAVIPIPALEEQKRIASILDKFETLVNDLNNGLPAEIEALQEQYEYYRDKLLTFERKA